MEADRATYGRSRPVSIIHVPLKRIKRVGFGFRRFAHYRIRVLLYAGKPNWDLLATVTPALTPR